MSDKLGRARELADRLRAEGHPAVAAQVHRATAGAWVGHALLETLREACQTVLTTVEALDPKTLLVAEELRLEVDMWQGQTGAGSAGQGRPLTDQAFARSQIAKYREMLADDREALDLVDAGARHFDQGVGLAGSTDTTGQYRARLLARIEMLEDLVRLYERDLSAWTGNGET